MLTHFSAHAFHNLVVQFCYVSILALLFYTRVLHATAPFVCSCAAVYKVLYTVYTMGDSVSDISADDFGILKDAGADLNAWMGNVRTTIKCKSHQDVTLEKFTKPGMTRDILAKMLFEGYQTVYSHRNTFESARVGVEKLKSELIAAQRSVVRLQQQLLDFQEKLIETQTEQLQEMSCVVDTAVDKGIKSYSQAISRTIKESVPVLSEQKLKKVVQEAVTDDDRSRNVVVFGLTEELPEDLDSKISSLFSDIEEKPSFEAVRIGEQSEDTNRPVKVCLRNSETVHKILQKAKNLRKSATYRTVYVQPDRSPEERAKHRTLVAEMRRRASEDPDNYYYIFSGEIFHRDKA